MIITELLLVYYFETFYYPLCFSLVYFEKHRLIRFPRSLISISQSPSPDTLPDYSEYAPGHVLFSPSPYHNLP